VTEGDDVPVYPPTDAARAIVARRYAELKAAINEGIKAGWCDDPESYA
jgi:hypothetical protein